MGGFEPQPWIEKLRNARRCRADERRGVRGGGHAAAVGDRQWATLLEAHHASVRHQLDRFRGAEIDTAGDGFFVAFDGPARGIRCAVAIRDAVRSLGLEIRAGLHTGDARKWETSCRVMPCGPRCRARPRKDADSQGSLNPPGDR